jgi:hypothetical protein
LQFKAHLGKKFVRPYHEKKNHKKRAGGVAQGVGPEFKTQYPKTKQNKKKTASQHSGG